MGTEFAPDAAWLTISDYALTRDTLNVRTVTGECDLSRVQIRHASGDRLFGVVGMLERKGRVRAEVVYNRTRNVLHSIAEKHLEPGSNLISDQR